MFKNYLLSAFRSFGRNKIFTLINVAGLAIGIGASLIIFLIVHYEFNYDKFHKDRDAFMMIIALLTLGIKVGITANPVK